MRIAFVCCVCVCVCVDAVKRSSSYATKRSKENLFFFPKKQVRTESKDAQKARSEAVRAACCFQKDSGGGVFWCSVRERHVSVWRKRTGACASVFVFAKECK